MAKTASHPLQVFIGCPGDMAPERDALLASRDHIESVVCPVKFTTWKMSASGVGEAQRVIFENDPVESFDIVVILVWSRLGLPSGVFDPLTKAEMTGTEAEFVAAYDLHQSEGGRRPQVLLYRCARKAEVDTSSPKLAEQMAQLQAVQQFFKQTEKGGLRPMLVQSFQTAEELKEFVTRDIKKAAGRLREAGKKTAAPAKRPSSKPKGENSGELLHRYFAGLRDQFSIYENVGLPVPERDGREGEKDAPIAIRRLFVEPSCTDAHLSPEAVDALLREGKNSAAPLLPRVAPAKSRTVLLADPGMGKSTLIQWLIATLADEAVPPGAEALRGAIPLPFILRDLVGHLPPEVKGWNWDALVDAFRQWRHRGKGAPLAAPLTADDALFRSILASPEAFFLIDGLDEIGDPQRRTAIRNAIWEGFRKYPDARWLITSRVVGYEQANVDQSEQEHSMGIPQGSWEKHAADRGAHRFSLREGRLNEIIGYSTIVSLTYATRLHLAPFDDTQQMAFARNWYVPRLGDAVGTQRADDFIAAVHRNNHTRVISRVPNLLYLLALLFRHRARLPDGRALVYAAISSAYLADIDLGRHLPDSLIVPWKFEEKEELLALVAMRMQEIRVARAKDEKGEVLVTREQLEEWLGPRFGGAGDAEACAELHRFLDHIANRSGLLLPRGEGLFGFAHLSFQEYYAACLLEKEFQRILTEKAQPAGDDIFGAPAAAAKKDEEKMFAEMAALPARHEPLLFLVEKLRHSAPYTSRILGWTFPQLATEPPVAQEGDALHEVQKWMPFTAAQLLAGISLDQEVTLDDAQRAKIWRSLWQAHIAAWLSGWNIAPSLVVAGSGYQTAVLEAAAALNAARFHLFHCTAVSDLRPLAGLASLRVLDLHHCTAVSDLTPLAGLPSLGTLWLNGCTAVSDLKPLAGLASLKTLNLNGCTAVSDAEVAALQASLPKLTIYR
ncbi:MAG TPA: NACHT domain-containing protein [Chthoniobacteraceae bacterium]|jgi:hypothetical protein|nr:NACHT domain-containing protein [Chthoniobacteraceae bacterium]